MAQASPIRTADELQNPELNYFIAFKVALNDTDPVKIEGKIKQVTSDPKGGILARRLLELKADAIEIMCNDAVYDAATLTYKKNAGGRKKEAAAAKSFKLKETVKLVEILCQTRKTLLKSEILDIVNTANKPVVYFTEDELNAEIAYLLKQGVKIIDNVDTKIPFSDYSQAEKNLKAADKRDLYDFLGVSANASVQEIEAASTAIYQSSSKTNDLKKKQLISTLCGTVKKLILKDATSRKTYDDYLVLKVDVWDEFEKRKSFGIKELSMDEYEEYVHKVITLLKVKVDEAEKTLAIGCKFYQLTIIGKSGDNSFEYCPYADCGKLYVKGAKSCPHCGRPLEIICWNCKNTTPFTKEDKGCPTCGATQHAHDMFTKKCAELDLMLSRPAVEISALQSAILGLKNIVPKYAANANSEVARKIKEYEQVIGVKVKEEETVGAKYRDELTQIQAHIAKKEYQTALAKAKSLTVKFNNYNADNSRKVINDINTVMMNVQKHVEMAKQYMKQMNESGVVTCAVKALEMCVDHSEAKLLLQKYPPKPVMNLRASMMSGGVRLEWDDRVKQDYITYTIIKKVGVAPTSPEDGAIVDKDLSIKFFEDKNVVSATPYFYAVYADRFGIKSPLCTSLTAVVSYADVDNVQQEVVDGGIKATWNAPQNVKSIEVWKNSGNVAPMRPGEGTKVECDKNGFYEPKAVGDNAYLIVCQYQLKDRTVASKGIRVVFKPFVKTSGLTNTAIEALGSNRYKFTCEGAGNGKVSLYYSNVKLPIPTDSTQKYLDFNRICKGLTPITTTLNANGEVTFSLLPGKIYQIYPIVSNDQLFVVSKPHLVNAVDGIKCSHTVSGGTVSVAGTLHPKASSIVVKVSQKDYAETLLDDGEKFTYSKDDFIKKGKFDIKLKANTINYISIFTEFNEDGVVSYAPAVKLNPPIDHRESVSVLFSMDYTVSPVKPFKVTITFEADKEVVIPKLLLMKGSPRPMNKNAGELCERLDEIKLKKGFFSKKYTGKHVVTVSPVGKNYKFALFLSDDRNFVQLKEVRKI